MIFKIRARRIAGKYADHGEYLKKFAEKGIYERNHIHAEMKQIIENGVIKPAPFANAIDRIKWSEFLLLIEYVKRTA